MHTPCFSAAAHTKKHTTACKLHTIAWCHRGCNTDFEIRAIGVVPPFEGVAPDVRAGWRACRPTEIRVFSQQLEIHQKLAELLVSGGDRTNQVITSEKR